MMRVHANLDPVLIFEDSSIEIMVVQNKIKKYMIHIINAYGPQEYESHDKIIKFYSTMDQVIRSAKIYICLILCEMDANAQVGCEVIERDPNFQSQNGHFFIELLQNNGLVLCNATEKCEGLITRTRKTKQRNEESIIDYLFVCEQMFTFLDRMTIDKANVLERYVKKGSHIRVTPSDHIPIFGFFQLKWSMKQQNKIRRNIFNFRDRDELKIVSRWEVSMKK